MEAIVSKHTSLNDNGHQENRYDRYHHVDAAHDLLINEWVSFQPPKCSLFSEEEVPRKHEISFNRWFLEVGAIQQSYAEPLVREAIVQSVKG